MEQIPCDNQIRTLRDPIAPSHRDAVFVEVFEGRAQHNMLAHFRVLGDQLLVALDGTNSFSSHAIQCQNCLTRQLTNGQTLSSHAAITPVIVCPGQSQGIALPPESIMPPDGHAKQDCERAAGKRWLGTYAAQVAPLSLNLLALLFHTVLEWSDDTYALLRRVLARRQTFSPDIQAFMRSMVFDHWDHLMDFMLRGLELESQFDTS